MKRLFFSVLALLLFSTDVARADLHGKADIGYVHANFADYLNGDKIQSRYADGVQINSTIVHPSGIAIKPTLVLGTGSCKIAQAGLSVGFYIPSDEWSFQPYIGTSYSYYSDFVSILNDSRKTTALAALAGLDVSYQPHRKWLISASFQYAYSHSDSFFKAMPTYKAHVNGANYGISVDYYVKSNVSVNLAYGYNYSLNKERYGLRARGVKAGVGYTF
ncbi:MAG: hypothetical protein K0S07_488 [Chlamydiales bacterium]|jgi:outer membrane protein W|nr:hypothetical protein [Chlamydiales bacterium]